MRFDAKLIILLILASLAGCAAVDPGFGEALRYDMAVQTIDPDPQYPADAHQPGYHGEKAQNATKRYRKGETKALRIERSTATGSGGSGSGLPSGSGGPN